MLLDTLVDLALDTPPSVQHSAVSGALRKVCFFGSLLVEPLQRTGVSQQSPARTVREAKKMSNFVVFESHLLSQKSVFLLSPAGRLMDASEEQDPAESPQWKRVIILLEMIQSRKSIEEVMLLVGPLYALLKRSLELGKSPHAEYIPAAVRADGPAGAWPVGTPPRTCFPGQVPAHLPEFPGPAACPGLAQPYRPPLPRGGSAQRDISVHLHGGPAFSGRMTTAASRRSCRPSRLSCLPCCKPAPERASQLRPQRAQWRR
ncbi:hypothetical protein V5799_003478 [Amblyomma americanum]|uniref:Uncharacterized protein n=1 Tax=Amblyomma americanum TaxID=6943 RepID=A0AAQ4D8U9_AMBAM